MSKALDARAETHNSIDSIIYDPSIQDSQALTAPDRSTIPVDLAKSCIHFLQMDVLERSTLVIGHPATT